jgi:hypothetical protein
VYMIPWRPWSHSRKNDLVLWSDRRDMGGNHSISDTEYARAAFRLCRMRQGSKGLDFAMLRVEIIFERNPCSRHTPLLLDLIKTTA